MTYTVVEFTTSNNELSEIIIALLEDLGFESFEEADNGLKAYIPVEKFDKKELSAVLDVYNNGKDLSYKESIIGPENWNAVWEKNFQPVKIGKFCGIRAPFHPKFKAVKYELVIEPKMSFGTGHHASTYLMIRLMEESVLKDKAVLDLGSGTGVLAILADKVGATKIDALDNNIWAFYNAKENIKINNSKNVNVIPGDPEDLKDGQYDVVLANLSRNTILQNFKKIALVARKGAIILLSGILIENKHEIINAGEKIGLVFEKNKNKDDWTAIQMKKIKE